MIFLYLVTYNSEEIYSIRLATFCFASSTSCLMRTGPINLKTSSSDFKRSNSFLTAIFSFNCPSSCCL